MWVHDFERGVAAPWIERTDGAASAGYLPDGRLAVGPLFPAVGTWIYPASGRDEPEFVDDLLIARSVDGTWEITTDDIDGLLGLGPSYLSHEAVDEGRRVALPGRFGAISHDEDWMLYTSERSGRQQAYLTRFPPDDDEWAVSTDGAGACWFAADASEIVYLSGQTVYRVSLSTEPAVRLGTPERLFTVSRELDIKDYDGRGRFVANRTAVWGDLYVDTRGIERD